MLSLVAGLMITWIWKRKLRKAAGWSCMDHGSVGSKRVVLLLYGLVNESFLWFWVFYVVALLRYHLIIMILLSCTLNIHSFPLQTSFLQPLLNHIISSGRGWSHVKLRDVAFTLIIHVAWYVRCSHGHVILDYYY